MNDHVVAYKPRKHPAIVASHHAFEDAFHKREYDRAASIVVHTAIAVIGVDGFVNALDSINNIIKRKRFRKGLP